MKHPDLSYEKAILLTKMDSYIYKLCLVCVAAIFLLLPLPRCMKYVLVNINCSVPRLPFPLDGPDHNAGIDGLGMDGKKGKKTPRR